MRYLFNERPLLFAELALADSSLVALAHASASLPPNTQCYQVDLMNLHMHEEWDAAFLLDVIEHLPDDQCALGRVNKALKPGGLLFVTVLAFKQFWSYNNNAVHHLRHYTRVDLNRLVKATGFTLLDARYFMFFLSPLYMLSRIKPRFKMLSDNDKKRLMLKQHAIPAKPIKSFLSAVFNSETPVGYRLQFPWGTSLLGVFKK